MLPVIAVVFDLGSATAVEIGAAASGLCDVVFVCDRSSAHVRRAMPVLEDVGDVVPFTDPDRTAATLRAIGVEGTIAFSDRELTMAAALAGRLGLPQHSEETALLLTDKHRQRSRLAELGVDTVRFAEIGEPDGAAAAALRVGVPAVLKPRRGSGSRGTELIARPDDLAPAVAGAFARGEEALVLEELLTGDERVAGPGFGDYVSVETLAGDVHRHLGITGKPPLAEPFRETGAFFPSTLRGEDAARAFAVTETALEALGVRHGVCHTELKLTPTGPRLIEVNGRLGGYVDDVVSRATGVSPLRLALAAALGQAVPPPAALASGRIAYQRFVLPPLDATAIREIRGVERARALPGVLAVELAKQPGERVDWREGTASAVVIVHGAAPDHAALAEASRSLDALLEIDYQREAGPGSDQGSRSTATIRSSLA